MHCTAYIALGSNLSFEGLDSSALLARAVTALQDAGLCVEARSGIWRTDAWPPNSGQPDYYNAVVAVDVGTRSPQAVYALLRAIETRYGRERRERWASRTLDLDIVAMEGVEGEFDGVTLPHPRMHERAFVLAPLAEIAPDWRHPGEGRTASALLAGLVAEGYRRVSDLGAGEGQGG